MNMAEEKEDYDYKEQKASNYTFKVSSKLMIVIIAIVALVIGFAVGFVTSGPSTTGMAAGDVISTSEAQKTAQAYIQNIVGAGSSVSVSNFKNLGNVYSFDVEIDGDSFTSYMSLDGKFLFPSAYDLTEETEPTETEQPTNIPKTETPEVELFVMSFCPYGTQAEQIMKPVFDLLGNKMDLNVRYIASVNGDTIDDIQALHGINEARENIRQLCIAKNYDKETLWNYISDIADGYAAGEISTGTIEDKWTEVAEANGIDVATIETCFDEEGIELMKADEAITDGYGVSGSPTLIINGVRYSGSRTSEAFKTSICSGFTEPPEECSETLSGTATTASGAC